MKRVYIYHDQIDAIGDKASTESETFKATHDTVEYISQLVQWIINNLNAVNIFVTADHGFLFQHSKPDQTDKTVLKDKPQNAVIAKKRYVIGKDLQETDDVWHGQTDKTANVDGNMEFLVPKGANLFHFTGGARFVHGGTMPQEIVVPIVSIRHEKGREREKTRVSKVPVNVILNSHKITTNQIRFRLVQMEPVSERVKEARFKVGIYDGQQPITNVERPVFDTSSEDMNDRTQWITLVLKGGDYDKNHPYHIVLTDAETDIEKERQQVTIDLAFTNDF